MVIAIDGPAGAGKSTIARATAERLGFTFLDTGAMYRAVALAAEERGSPPGPVAETIELEVGDRVLLDGRDVTELIRTPEISRAAARIAADVRVRRALVARQQAILRNGDWVAEGRDIGTVVAPEAEVKVWLDASPQERARRRARELGADPEQMLREQALRDQRDAQRVHSPSVPAADAVPVDTTGLSVDEVVDQLVMLATEAREMAG